MKTIELQAIEFESVAEALQYTEASGSGRAIRFDGKFLVVEESGAERIEAAGVEFAFLADHAMPDGSFRIMTIPVN